MTRTRKYRGMIRELVSEMRFYIRTGVPTDYNCITKCFDLIHYNDELTTGLWERDLKFAKLIFLFAKTDIDCGIGLMNSGIAADKDTDEDDPEKNTENCD